VHSDSQRCGATLAVREVSDEPEFVLATEPPTAGQRRLALAVIAVLFAAFGVTVAIGLTAPFALIPVRIDAFVPVITAIFFVNDFITATLLFGQFSIIRSRALLVIASAYLFTGLMAIPFVLTFPGQFSPTGLLGAGLQSSAWIYNFWHYGFPVAVIIYAILRGVGRANNESRGSTRSAISWSVAIVISLVCGLTWLATAGDEFLPRLFLDSIHPTPLARIVTSSNSFICALALALLYSSRRSVLDLWLMVVMVAWITELAILDVLLYPRFTFGFYAGRGFALITSVVVLVVLLAEMTRLYVRLARSNRALQRERNNKLMNLEAMAASISHEVSQPLAAIATNGGAALRFLGHTPPDLEDARSALNRIVTASHLAREVFDNIRALFGSADQGQETVDVNEIIFGALGALRGELEEHGITTRAELTPELPIVLGHRGQLQEVILNLIHNAIEAMDAKDGSRVLRVSTQHHDRDTITVAVEDTGPGIDPEKVDGIFDAFVTTKPKGMGLGLAICRMIVERHGGQLSVWSDKNRGGALFQFVLPVKSAAGPIIASD
jgi:signal transduction histidine kinase